MPLHDWSDVPDNVFHSFHVGWLWNLARALNTGLLPEGYTARAEEYVGPYAADVLTLQEEGASDDEGASEDAGAAAPEPTVVLSPPRLETWSERRITVFSARDERRVAVIEVTSRGNKDSRRRADFFRRKLLECLGAGLHLLVVDILPATDTAPGFAADLARELGDRSGCVPFGGRAATSFERRDAPLSVRIYHRPLTTGTALPDVPLFLLGGAHVDVPLEATYDDTVSGLGPGDRARLRA